MKKLLPLFLLLAACAGRAERDILPTRGYDQSLDCDGIAETHRNNEETVDKRVTERSKTKQRNAIVGTTAALVFTPLFLATDLRDIEKNEILGLKRRNEVLRDLAKDQGCPLPNVRHQELYNALMR